MPKQPAYMRLYTALKEDIIKGTYPYKSLLPPEPELEDMFNVSRTTVRHAISKLVNEEFITVQQGYGTRVVYNPNLLKYSKFHNIISVKELYLSDDTNFSVKKMHIDIVPAEEDIAHKLAVNTGEQVYRMQRILLLNNQPFGIMTNYLPRYMVPDIDQYSGMFTNLYSFIEKKYNIVFEHGEETVHAIVADFIDSNLLEIDINFPLLYFRRTAYCAEGPFEYVETKLRSDMYCLKIEMKGKQINNFF